MLVGIACVERLRRERRRLPFHLEVIKLKVLRSIYYLSNARLYGAIEIACLDIQGKALGRPMCDLLGGAVRDRVALMGEISWRYDRPGGGDDTRAIAFSTWCRVRRWCPRATSASSSPARSRRPLAAACCRSALAQNRSQWLSALSPANRRLPLLMKVPPV